MTCRVRYKRAVETAQTTVVDMGAVRHLHVVFVDGGAEDRAASPSEHDGLEDGHIGGFVKANDGDERVGLLVHAVSLSTRLA